MLRNQYESQCHGTLSLRCVCVRICVCTYVAIIDNHALKIRTTSLPFSSSRDRHRKVKINNLFFLRIDSMGSFFRFEEFFHRRQLTQGGDEIFSIDGIIDFMGDYRRTGWPLPIPSRRNNEKDARNRDQIVFVIRGTTLERRTLVNNFHLLRIFISECKKRRLKKEIKKKRNIGRKNARGFSMTDSKATVEM